MTDRPNTAAAPSDQTIEPGVVRTDADGHGVTELRRLLTAALDETRFTRATASLHGVHRGVGLHQQVRDNSWQRYELDIVHTRKRFGRNANAGIHLGGDVAAEGVLDHSLIVENCTGFDDTDDTELVTTKPSRPRIGPIQYL